MINREDLGYKIFWRNNVEHNISKHKSILALGTFDGVHVAHKKLIDEAVSLKSRTSASLVGVWCFSQSPAGFFKGITVPALTLPDQKIKILLDLGADFVAIGDFASFCTMSADNFIGNVLISRFNCIGTVCGFNHKFGYKGLGDTNLLKDRFGDTHVVSVDEIKMFGQTVSSTAIRMALLEGDPIKAEKMLGRRFALEAPVVHGKQLGRELEFPTANQYFTGDLIVPKHGIYATVCTLESGRKYIGVSNVGVRPTISDDIDSHIANCETFICDFSGDLYGQILKVEFCAYLREEQCFASIVELRSAIMADKEAALKFFGKNKIDLTT